MKTTLAKLFLFVTAAIAAIALLVCVSAITVGFDSSGEDARIAWLIAGGSLLIVGVFGIVTKRLGRRVSESLKNMP